jgi:hypothetical protein
MPRRREVCDIRSTRSKVQTIRRVGLAAMAALLLIAAAARARGCAKEASVADAAAPRSPAVAKVDADADAAPRRGRVTERTPTALPRARTWSPIPAPPIELPPAERGRIKEAWQQAISKDMGDHLTVFIEECHELAAVDRREDGEITLVLQLLGEPGKGVTVADVELRMTSSNEALRECITASAADVQVSSAATPAHWYEDRFELSVTTSGGRRAYVWGGEPIHYQ